MLAESAEECGQVEVWLHLYLDGECGPEDRPFIEAHLASCDHCRQSLVLLEKTRAGLLRAAEQSAPDVPAALAERVKEGLAAWAPRRPLRVALRAALVVGVVAAAGIALVAIEDAAGEEASALADRALDPMVQDLIDRHTLDVPVDVASPDPERVEAFLRPRVGEPLSVPRLERVGLGLRGGRVVTVEGRGAALLVYHSGLGRRVSVVAIPDHDGQLMRRLGGAREGRAIRSLPVWMARTGTYELSARRVGPTLYTVVGEVPQKTVEAVALALAPQP